MKLSRQCWGLVTTNTLIQNPTTKLISCKLILRNKSLKKLAMATPSDSLPDKVQIVVDEVLKEQGFENAEISVNLFTLKGENYMGIIYGVRAAIFGKKIELIVKVAPAIEDMRAQFPIDKIYEREFFVYKNLLPEFDKLQINAGIPKGDRLHSPKCYKISNDYLSETLVLEDLKASGFKIFNRFDRYDFEHTRLTLETIGKYHAHSFVLQRDHPEKFAYFVENMQERIFVEDATPEFKANTNSFFLSSIAKAIENLDSDELKEKLNKFGENFYDKVVESLKPKGVTVLGHGDCWSNNMMYKYEDGKPVDIRLLDYQIGRYCSPVLDITYFIFCCTDQDLRKEHYDDMLKAYHNSLRDHLARFSLDVEKCYPWSTMLEDLKTLSTYALCMAVNNVLMFSTEEKSVSTFEEITPDQDWNDIPMFKMKPSEQYRYKINGLVADFHKLGYF